MNVPPDSAPGIGNGDRRLMTSVVLAAVGLTVLAGWLPFAEAASENDFLIGTLLLVGVVVLLGFAWPTVISRRPRGAAAALPVLSAIAMTIVGLFAAVIATRRMLPDVFAGMPNPYDSDMLVIIEHGIRQFFSLSNPYVIHQVPWPAPLPYGPWLWLPYTIPHLTHTDYRILTLIAQLVVPGACVAAAVSLVLEKRAAPAMAMTGLAGLLLVHPQLVRFHRIGHTQVYWPLLLLFCWSLRSERWTASALLAGSIVVARTTMVALIPVFVMHLFFRGALTARRVALMIGAALIPWIPFLIADPRGLAYAVYGNYGKVIKGSVWTTTDWTQNTYGLTGLLLRHGLERYVEVSQIAALVLTYVFSWKMLKRGRPVEPLLAVALLAFSMTTIWPIIYVYYDVFILVAAALSACAVGPLRTTGREASAVAALICAAAMVVFGVAAFEPGAAYTVDIGTPATQGLTGAGFGRDIAVTDNGRSFVWVEGDVARVRLPRAGWRGAAIHVIGRAHRPRDHERQVVSATLNGHRLGVADIGPEWTDASFTAPRRVWYYGFNLLELRFRYVSPAAEGSDTRELSAAIDRIEIDD